MAKTSFEGKGQAGPSSNWMALQKTLSASNIKGEKKILKDGTTRKKRKLSSTSPAATSDSGLQSRWTMPPPASLPDANSSSDVKNGESLSALRKMIFGQLEYTANQRLPGKYIAMDCEMVGVGIDGQESSLARVSLVNFYGVIQLDEIVRQKERVVDYRTQWSGIRESDMVRAKSFEEVQKTVDEILKDRILVGHAVFNDLKVLLLSHPRPQTRDTQYYAGKYKVTSSKHPALRNLVKQELGVTIQGGEHSSVTDARATMAVYRLHRKQWEKGTRPTSEPFSNKKRKKSGRDIAEDDADGDDAETGVFPGGGRRGVSSGLSTVIKRSGSSSGAGKSQWWKELAGGTSKGTLSMKL